MNLWSIPSGAVAMSFERLKQWSRTLRVRLMVWNAGLVLLVAIPTLFGLREGIRYTLFLDFDDSLKEDVQEISLAVEEANAPPLSELYEELNRKARGHQTHGWHVRFFDADGHMLWSSTDAPQVSQAVIPARNLEPISVVGYRLIKRQMRGRGQQLMTVVVGASDRVLREIAELINRFVAIAGAIVFFAAPLGGYWLAGRTTRPLAEMIHMTSRLRPSRLQERLPNRHTGDELDQLAVTFNRMLDRIAVYIQLKRDFIANSAHELRSPLAAIRSSIEVALAHGRSAAEYEDLLSEVIEQCASLEALVNQLLMLAETDADRLKFHREHVFFDDIVRKSVQMFDGVAESKDVRLRLESTSPVPVNGNPQHLRHVINNLIDNAIKFTNSGGEVVVRLLLDEPLRQAVLTVRDSGIGISQEDLPRVFDRFFRVDRARTRSGGTSGTGLGLTICQAVVQSHEGAIRVESELGHGTTFEVRLPLITDPIPLPDVPPSAPPLALPHVAESGS